MRNRTDEPVEAGSGTPTTGTVRSSGRNRAPARGRRASAVSPAGTKAGAQATRPASHKHEALRVHVRIASCYNVLMREARRRVSERWNLTLAQFDVLAELARADEQGFTFIELSRLLLVTSGNLTGIVDRLEQQQLVRRVPHSSDRRVIRVTLTDKGWALTREMLPHHENDVGEVLSFTSHRTLVRLSALLDELKEGLHRRESGGKQGTSTPK